MVVNICIFRTCHQRPHQLEFQTLRSRPPGDRSPPVLFLNTIKNKVQNYYVKKQYKCLFFP